MRVSPLSPVRSRSVRSRSSSAGFASRFGGVWLLLPALVLASCDGDPAAPATLDLVVTASLGLPVAAPQAGILEVRGFVMGREGALEGAPPMPQATASLAVEAGSRNWTLTLPALPAGGQVRVEATLRTEDPDALSWSGEEVLRLPRTGAGRERLLLRAGPPSSRAVSALAWGVPGPIEVEAGGTLVLPFQVAGGDATDVRSISLTPSVARPVGRTSGGGGFGEVLVDALSPGDAEFLILSGLRLAQVTVRVLEPITGIDVLPGSTVLSSLGDSLLLTAEGRTATGIRRPLPGPVLWNSTDPGIVTVDGIADGAAIARAVGNGEVHLEVAVPGLPGVEGRATVTVQQTPRQLERVAGLALAGSVGDTAIEEPRIRALDARGNPVPGVPVVFAVTAEGATIDRVATATDSAGEAGPGRWIFGIRPGIQRLDVAVEGGLVDRFLAEVSSGAPTRLEPLAPGFQQTGVGGEAPEPPMVRALDSFGNPVPGVALRGRLLPGREGMGSVAVPFPVTDVGGEATLGPWTASTTPGVDTLQVELASGGQADPTFFLLQVLPGAPSVLEFVVGGEQRAPAGTPLPSIPMVRLLDGFGNALEGVDLQFEANEGSVPDSRVVTDREGLASSGAWTLGPVAGIQRLVARVGALADTLVATATVGAPAQLLPTAGGDQVAPVGQAVPVAPAARVTDAFGNPVTGAAVSFAITGGGGSVVGATPVTGPDGIASVGAWFLGGIPGVNTLTVSVAGQSLTFSATAVVGTPARLVVVEGEGQTGPVGTDLPLLPRVRLEDALGNPVAGVSVAFDVTAGGGSISSVTAVTDVAGTATPGVWTLGPLGGLNRLRASTGGLAAVLEALATVPCLVMAVGESYATTLEGAASLCFEAGGGGGEYTLIAANPGLEPLALTLTGSGTTPVTGPPAPFVATLSRTAPPPSLTTSLLSFPVPPGTPILEAETEGPGATPSRYPLLEGEQVLPLIPVGVPDLGASWSLNVAEGCVGPRDERTGIVRVVGTHVIVVSEEANPAGGYTLADYQALADEIDGIIAPAVTTAFGAPTDLDGNGRVVLFVTQAVNAGLDAGNANTAFVRSEARDLAAEIGCPRSNEGEIVYAAAPDPDGLVSFVPIPTFVAVEQTLRGVARELYRVIAAGARGGLAEEPWLDEALGAVAEELAFYRASGDLIPGQNLGIAEITATLERFDAFNRYASLNLVALDLALASPRSTQALGGTSSLAERGLAWAFLRYAADRRGGDPGAFWSSFLTSSSTGLANVAQATQADPVAWYRDFLGALYADDVVPGLPAGLTFPSWGLRDLYAGSSLGTFNLEVFPILDGSATDLTLAPEGGSVFFRFGVPSGEVASLDLTSGGSAPLTREPILVIRTR